MYTLYDHTRTIQLSTQTRVCIANCNGYENNCTGVMIALESMVTIIELGVNSYENKGTPIYCTPW